ncbi:MAG: recombinase family protein [Proteobacteria bacterium]|nr:recombinase family protein [Pseudomonadota bacterium]
MVKAKSNPTSFVAYYRVSTDKQGQSGLGLEAQRAAVLDFVNGGAANLIAEYTETESGKRNDRPQLAEALQVCKKHKAKLVIAKLDRLARNVAFISNLMESGVDFVAVDMPDANRLTVHILAAVAEHEREMISQRTKAALQAAKARGVKLGCPNPIKGSKVGVAAQKAQADQFATNVVPIIQEIEASGVTSHLGISKVLNARGIPTARGGDWYAATVRNIRSRAVYLKTKIVSD